MMENTNYEMTMKGDITNLLKKFKVIINSVNSIPKNGNNTEYDYVTERDVVNVLRKQLVDNDIMLIPNIIKSSTREVELGNSRKTSVVTVIMSYTFFDLENGSFLRTYYQGEGEDTMDKGIYKAITGCQKYALLKTFLVPTGGDPEEKTEKNSNFQTNVTSKKMAQEPQIETINTMEKEGDTLEETISPEKARKVFAMAKAKNINIINILASYGYKTTFEIKEKDLSEIVNNLKVS